MNSHKFNMYAAGLIGSLLVFLLLNFFSDLIYRGVGHHGEAPLGFAVAVEESAGATSTAEAIDYAALLAAADPAKGEKVFGKCKSCHSVEEGENGVGPSLHGIVGEKIGEVAGYTFSDALKAHEGNWDFASLNEWLTDPKTFAPGNKMSFAGLSKPEDRVNVIAYLNQAGGAPVELVAPGGGEATAPAATEGAAQPAATTETAAATTETAPAAATTETAPAAATTETAPAAAPAATETTAAAPAGAGDAAKGEKVFRKCRACHQVAEGKNGVGPSLWGVVGRVPGTAEGYSYSDAMKNHGGKWDLAALEAFLTNPMGVVPGTKMSFPGLKSAQDRLDVITYLNEADGTPEPLQ